MKTVVGVFESASEAEHAVDELVSRGFDIADITFLSPDRALERGAARSADEGLAEPPVGVVPLGVATAHPGMPPASPFHHPQSPFGKNAVYNDINTSINNLELAEAEAQSYRRVVERGGTLVAVQTNDERSAAALAILRQWNAQELS